jgi:parallel beta-helix repeat protein
MPFANAPLARVLSAVALLVAGCSSAGAEDSLSDQAELSAKRCGNGVCNRNESCSSCPADCGACPSEPSPPPPSTEPPPPSDTGTTTGVGPQASITCPEGAVRITTSQDIPSTVDASPTGTTFCIAAGVHYPSSPINPKNNQSLIGEYGAIIDGRDVKMTYDTGSTSIIRGWNCTNCSYVTIRNLVVRNLPGDYHCVGDSLNGGENWVVDHNEVTGCLRGVQVYRNGVVSNNYIHHNAGDVNSPDPLQRGGGYGCYTCPGSTWVHNEIAYNGPEQKLGPSTNVTFRGNYLHHNAWDAIWYDSDSVGSLIEDNLVEDNPGNGIHYEVCGQGVIRNNIIRRSGTSGIYLSTSRDVEVYGNTIEDTWRGINLFAFCPALGIQYAGSVDHDLTNNWIHDNIIKVGTRSDSYASTLSTSSSCTSTQAQPYANGSKNNRFQGNGYFVPDVSSRYWYFAGASLMTFGEWRALGQDTTGTVAPR